MLSVTFWGLAPACVTENSSTDEPASSLNLATRSAVDVLAPAVTAISEVLFTVAIHHDCSVTFWIERSVSGASVCILIICSLSAAGSTSRAASLSLTRLTL